MGETYFSPTVGSNLAHALCELGRHDEALELTIRAEEQGASDDVATQALWRRARAKALAHAGRGDQALEFAREAVDLLRPTDAPIWQADALRDLAVVLAAVGAHKEALARLGEALSLYASKGDVTSFGRTQAFSLELSGSTVPA
jgi:tetratricopeptide (TPR) repeat protein